MTGAALPGQTQPPPEPHAEILVIGGSVQNGLGVQIADVTVVVAFSGVVVIALTNTGMIWPVLRLKDLWPSTRKIDAISPE